MDRMNFGKYGKYFITDFKALDKENPWARSSKPNDEKHLLRLDSQVIEGIKFFAHCNFFMPSLVDNPLESRSTKPHSHTYDEIIGMVGTDPDNPNDLGGEIEIIMDDESHIIDKSCIVYIPAGLHHGPFRELSMKRPIFQFEFGLHGLHD